MQYEIEVTLRRVGQKTLYGKFEIPVAEFILLKQKDRWDLDRFLRSITKDLTTGVVEQVYLQDTESVIENVQREENIETMETTLFTHGIISPELIQTERVNPEKG